MTINDYAIRGTPNVKPRTILSQAYLYRKVQRLFRKEVQLEISTNWKCQDINTQIIIYWRLFVEIFKDIKKDNNNVIEIYEGYPKDCSKHMIYKSKIYSILDDNGFIWDIKKK